MSAVPHLVRSLRSVDSPAPAVTRAVALLEELARSGGPLTLTELARRLDLAKSTVANLCAALEGSGMVRRSDIRWALGYKVVELGQGFLAGTDLVAEFRRLTDALPAGHAETMLLAVLDGADVLYLARHDGSQPVRLASDVGRRLPAVVTALGKAMLASLPPEALDARLAAVGELPLLTARSHRTLDALHADLRATRARGFAVDDEQSTEGVTCLGVAIPGFTDPPTAVGTTLLAARMTTDLREALVRDLTDLAQRLATLSRL
jgi:IclR family transcriptional regulator, blcABC operon repressor